MAVLKSESCKPMLDYSDLKNSITEGKESVYSIKSQVTPENDKKVRSPVSKSLNISSDALEKSVNSTSTDLMPFYSEPSSLKKSSSFMNLNSFIMRKNIETIGANIEKHQHHENQHRHRHHRNSIADSNPSRIKSVRQKEEENLNLKNFEVKSKDLKENSYRYFIDSLNCDTNCSCAFHKNSTKQQSKPCSPVHQYYHHPYYHHKSFDQNLRLSQLNLLTQTPIKNNENAEKFLNEKLSDEVIVNKNVESLNNRKEKIASQSILERCFMLMLSFFGNLHQNVPLLFKSQLF